VLALAAVAAGVDGIFMEVHDNPKEAKSDGPNALDSRKLRGVLKELLAVQTDWPGRTPPLRVPRKMVAPASRRLSDYHFIDAFAQQEMPAGCRRYVIRASP